VRAVKLASLFLLLLIMAIVVANMTSLVFICKASPDDSAGNAMFAVDVTVDDVGSFCKFANPSEESFGLFIYCPANITPLSNNSVLLAQDSPHIFFRLSFLHNYQC
jgi:hypothetical protein